MSRIRLIRFILAIAVILSSLPALAQYEEGIERFSDWADQRIASDPAPGISIGFVKDDFMWADGFGYSDIENGVEAHAESAYRLASVTKSMTAVGILLLVEQGKVDLDAEIQTYVPYFPKKKWPVTVRQVLGHLGGISHYRNYDEEGHFKDHKDTREAIAVFEDFDLVAEPGTQFNYSSYGYNLLGAVIEEASGQSYGDFMRERLWEPLGMDATRMDDPDAIIPNRVRGYRRGPDGEVINSEFVDISSRFAAGGTRSTVIDLLKYAKGLYEGKILTPESMELMLTPMVMQNGRSTGYAMGWDITPRNGHYSAGHSGGQAETATYLLWFPEEKLAIAAATNLEGGSRFPYIFRLYEEITGEVPAPAIYVGGWAEAAVHSAMREAWNEGLSEIERSGAPLSSDPKELRDAFRYFNANVSLDALRKDRESVSGRIENGSHPVGGNAIQIVGSYMASRLIENRDADQVAGLHRRYEIPFFAAYVRLYRDRKNGIPRACRFSRDLERLIEKWDRDWSKTWNDRTLHIDIGEGTDVGATVAMLKKEFAGASVYPNVWGPMSDQLEQLAMAKKIPEAYAIAEAGRELYPALGSPHFYSGLLTLAMGSPDEAIAHLRKAEEVDPASVSAGFLNGWAYQLKGTGYIDLGMGLLQAAIELHPGNANLYDSLGEFHLEKGDRDRAIELYEKALEVDPEFENAKRMLEKIRSE